MTIYAFTLPPLLGPVHFIGVPLVGAAMIAIRRHGVSILIIMFIPSKIVDGISW